MRGRLLIAVTLVGISVSILGASIPASGTLRIDIGANIQADAETWATLRRPSLARKTPL